MGSQLNILSEKERREIYNLPKFKKKQRFIYLEFSLPEQELVRKYKSPVTKVYFLLQLAYFKFKQQFFVFNLNQVSKDIVYLQEAYFAGEVLPTEGIASKPIRLKQQKVILKLMNYQMANGEIRKQLFNRACQLSVISASPVFIFRDLINWTKQKRIVLPGSSTMEQRIIGKALTLERKRLEKILAKQLSKEHAAQMDYLINEKIGYYYGLTWLQQEAPNFNPQSIRKETNRKEIIAPLFKLAQPLLEKLGVSNENINYYASLANHYTVGELRQFKGGMHYIFLLSFIRQRYQECNDVLAEAFKYYVRKYETQAKQIVKEYFYQFNLDANEQLPKITMILALFLDDSIPDDTPFIVIKKKVLEVLDQEKILLLNDFIEENHIDETELRWQHYEEIQKQISYNLRHIFKFLDFIITGETNQELMKAVTFVKALFAKGKTLKKAKVELVPKGFIPKYLQPYIFKKDGFVAPRYELMLYQSLSKQLQGGNIFIEDSVSHQSLEADLIPLDYWKQNKEQILKQIDLEKLFLKPEAILKDLKKELESKIKIVNRAILKGDNKDVKIEKKPDGSQKWKLIYNAKEEETNHQIYNQFPVIGIVPLLNWVNEQTQFSSAFKHILEKGGRKKADKDLLTACIVALGTNHGIGNIAGRSDMNYNHLKRTLDSFVRAETLKEANRIIVDATADLPMFDAYNVEPEKLHSSSDGQKYPTRFDTINSRYSKKYFGMIKGIALNTLVINGLPANLEVFGSNNHESHYVFDLLYNNLTKLDPKTHSTDTHGTNRVNFAILDIFGYQFAPRYKNFPKEADKLVGFKKPSKYPDKYLIKPCRKLNEQAFIDGWDMFQRINASLALRTTTQSKIIRKLSSFNRMNEGLLAFIEYNDLIKSIFMLDYIHLTNFKQNIQTVLNRGEGYHRLRKNISYAHDGKFQVHSQAEQIVWSECTRLIANAIIYYNTYLLSQLLKKHSAEGNEKLLKIIRDVSPIAWLHINLHGLFRFKNVKVDIDWEEMLKDIKIMERE